MPVSWILFGYMLRRCSVKSTLQSLHINAKMCICWDYPMRVKMNLLLRFREQIFRPILGFETNLATNIKKVKISKGGCFWKKLKSESELHFHLWSLLLAIMALQCKYNIFTEKLSQRKEITSREYHQRSSKIRMCSPRSTTQSRNMFSFSFW